MTMRQLLSVHLMIVGSLSLAQSRLLLNLPFWPDPSNVIHLMDYYVRAPVERTGVVISMRPGDDGDLQAGTAWPNPRFTDNTDGTITDNLTGLMWLKETMVIKNVHPTFDNDGVAGDGLVTWQSALDFAAAVNAGTYDLGSIHQDWRLPNASEFLSLVHNAFISPALSDTTGTSQWTEGDPFTGLENFGYWTSTGTFTVTLFIPDFGHANEDIPTSFNATWLVRSGGTILANAPVEKTGQMTSHAVGDDGDLEAGEAWFVPRFIDNGDGTVTDQMTGLMWTKDANAILNHHPSFDTDGMVDGKVSLQDALDFVEGINNGTYHAGISTGYMDWRLANIKEIISLQCREYEYPNLSDTAGTGPWQDGDPFIRADGWGPSGDPYWTSTPSMIADRYETGRFDRGQVSSQPPNDSLLVWAVRGQSQ